MVDLLVDACVRAKEVTRAAAVASSGALPRAGRDLVPYFNPGSTDWGLEDVNGNVEDSDSSDDSVRSFESASGDNHRRKAAQSCEQTPTKASAKSKKRAAKRGKVAKAEQPQPVAAVATLSTTKPNSVQKDSFFAGTTFGLASPLPEHLPMPTSSLLSRKPATPVASARATSAHRNLLQLEGSTRFAPSPMAVRA